LLAARGMGERNDSKKKTKAPKAPKADSTAVGSVAEPDTAHAEGKFHSVFTARRAQ
jgi:hypothetical protein